MCNKKVDILSHSAGLHPIMLSKSKPRIQLGTLRGLGSAIEPNRSSRIQRAECFDFLFVYAESLSWLASHGVSNEARLADHKHSTSNEFKTCQKQETQSIVSQTL